MEYKIQNKEIHILIPAFNEGKFRFKTRDDNFKFGNSFATRSNVFNKDVYLEWQIGYDATKQEIKNEKKNTKLTKISFVGSNKKVKYPYELSEFVYAAAEIGLISVKSLSNLLKEIEGYKNYLSDRKIDVQHHGEIALNGITFKETSIRLPTFFLANPTDGTQIETSIQKQQYATGVQPMVYFSIPLKSFLNGNELDGRTSKSRDKLTYIIGKNNVDVLFSMLKVFGMASPAHNHDIKEIIKVLLKLF